MKKDQYFPLEVNILSDEKMSYMMDKYSLKGLGAYIVLLLELRKDNNYRCNETVLRMLSRTHRTKPEILLSIVRDFGLFEYNDDKGLIQISSPYLNRVMEKLDEMREKASEGASKNVNKRKRNPDGTFTRGAGTVKESKEEESKETTTTNIEVAEVMPEHSWENYLNEALKNEPWMELLAHNSGLYDSFRLHREEIIEAFRTHILLQGTAEGIQSLKDAKSYLTNFLRPGTPMHTRLAEQLAHNRRASQTSPHNPHETVDPLTGERTYYGNIIPCHAPPRPHIHAVWSEELDEWLMP